MDDQRLDDIADDRFSDDGCPNPRPQEFAARPMRMQSLSSLRLFHQFLADRADDRIPT